MIEQVNEPVSVVMIYAHGDKKKTKPWFVEWRKKRWLITELGLPYQHSQGRDLISMYQVIAENGLCMKLSHNTRTNQWLLEEVSDGQTE
jgi:hypothetical protein